MYMGDMDKVDMDMVDMVDIDIKYDLHLSSTHVSYIQVTDLSSSMGEFTVP